jgi:release factor glutamine methyltransferase
MLSILEVIERTTTYFAKNGVTNPRLQAEWLMADVLGCKRLDLYLRFDKPLEEAVLEKLRPMVKRRARREPLQYIIGNAPFLDLALKCDARALIPRPETEELVGEVLRRVGAKHPAKALDLGTGTGAIALSLARAWPETRVTAADLSPEALALAKENAAANGLTERVTFISSDWFSAVSGEFGVIVSNPPYLTDQEWSDAEPEVRDHEPKNALVAPEEGLADLEAIVRGAAKHLAPGGLLALETGIAHHAALAKIAAGAGYSASEGVRDLAGQPRYFFARR